MPHAVGFATRFADWAAFFDFDGDFAYQDRIMFGVVVAVIGPNCRTFTIKG
jgi:hypothetical protein